METVYCAKVAVSTVPYFVDRPYTYLVPEELRASAVAGVRVTVPFGRGNACTEGFVLETGEEDTDKPLKGILSVLDESPLLTADEIRLALFVQERTFCTFYEALKAMLPAGLWYRFSEEYRFSDGVTAERAATMTEIAAERSVIAALEQHGGTLPLRKLSDICGEKTEKTLSSMVKKNILTAEKIPLRKTRDSSRRMLSLACDAETALAATERRRKSAPVRYEVIRFLASVGEAAQSEVLYYTGATAQTVRGLVRDGFLAVRECETLRVPKVEKDENARAVTLNEEQQAAFDGLLSLMESGTPAVGLLEGVTGSGKTLVYLKLAEEALRRGKTAMILVPEIALTPQLMTRFAAYFGDTVAMLHSSLGIPERYDQWKRIRRGEVRVVLGTRSAVFAPLRDLALLVIDEEQEDSYVSENAPRYHTRDVAKYRIAKHGGLLLLGSATPSVETAYYARSGRYHPFYLRKRFNEQELPRVLTVDLREEVRRGNGSAVSGQLADEIQKNLDAGEQTILFLNRRGNSRMLICGACGSVPYCPRCSVPLTYHSANRRLMCHYCGYSEPAQETCPDCGGRRKPVGTGTQKVAEELSERFPSMRILRMDYDTVSARNTHEKILKTFSEEKVPLLLGTQMVAKGLDFPNVTLVGVLEADLSLYVDSYRAAERTFGLLTQVVGRSGRGEKPGRALIQTFTPENDVIENACAQDYGTFYENEIRLRRIHRVPPFADRVTLTVSGSEENKVRAAAGDLQRVLARRLNSAPFTAGTYEVIGPAAAPIVKVNNRFRYRVLLSGENTKKLRDALRQILMRFPKEKAYRGMHISVDTHASE